MRAARAPPMRAPCAPPRLRRPRRPAAHAAPPPTPPRRPRRPAPPPLPPRYPPLEAIGELTPDEIAFVNSYMVATGARMVKFGANMTTVGYQNRTSARRASNTLYYTADAPMGTSGISASSSYSSGGLVMWVHPA
jgi:hypothetical protein